ncbi:hypothetical protein PVNG_02461 [Plasmodium vivax North Korean]|uniref:Uncharacterized protein n=1 Tax=Plasmodium vivax North Korean TaxID=1035514 RepID=A0A0J9W6U9_PLAVI|nr:hypothetical protein PVNG_02461 [Plasmodium vivax North Korean]
MSGRSGNSKRTIQNLRILLIDSERNLVVKRLLNLKVFVVPEIQHFIFRSVFFRQLYRSRVQIEWLDLTLKRRERCQGEVKSLTDRSIQVGQDKGQGEILNLLEGELRLDLERI